MTTLPGPLVAVDWLEVNLPDVVAVDCRWQLTDLEAGRAAYETGHIPGALYVSLDDDLSDMAVPDAGRHPLPTREHFVATLGRLGIGNGTTVVAYDDAGGAYASRLWWMLRWVGHDDVAVLDGGIAAWPGALEPGAVWRPETEFELGESTMPTADRDAVGGRAASTVLIDARGAERYRGEVEPLDPAAGHVPGAVNAPFAANLVDGQFSGATALADRFSAIGVQDAGSAIVYCGSGVTACHNILAMEVAGMGTATLYPGSWSDWSTSGGEVETGG